MERRSSAAWLAGGNFVAVNISDVWEWDGAWRVLPLATTQPELWNNLTVASIDGNGELGEHRLRVLRDQLVQHGPLGCAATVPGKRLSGRTGRAFAEAAREHARAK